MIKLHYFDLAGRGEPIRMLLVHARVPFEDHRIAFAEWSKFKDTFEGKQVPVLEIDGKKLAQSYAILEYLGTKYGYLPTDPKELYQTIFVMNTCEDLGSKFFEAIMPMSPFDEATKKKKLEELAKVTLPLSLSQFEKMLEAKCNKDFLVGCKYTLADFYFLGMFGNIKSDPQKAPMWASAGPLLNAYVEKRMKDFEHYYCKTSCCKPKLYYFDMPARGEMVRLLLRHAKVDFEDIRIKYEDWPAMKDKFPLKQVPVYECCGVQYPQTDAIMHMLSAKHGYLPLDSEKLYRVLFISNTMKDLFGGFCKFEYGGLPAEKAKKAKEDFYATSVPMMFNILEKRLQENDSHDFFVGSQYTMADFYAVGAARWLILNPQTEKDFAKALNACPLLKAYFGKRMPDFK